MERLFRVPAVAFKDKWPGWAVFLGNGKQAKRSPESWVPVAEALAKSKGGVLPCWWWLIKNRLSGLGMAIKRRPELFQHIKQDRKHATHNHVGQWVRVAEKLAQENDGIIPGPGWLRKNGFKSLDNAMKVHRLAFSHITQLNRRSKAKN